MPNEFWFCVVMVALMVERVLSERAWRKTYQTTADEYMKTLTDCNAASVKALEKLGAHAVEIVKGVRGAQP